MSSQVKQGGCRDVLNCANAFDTYHYCQKEEKGEEPPREEGEKEEKDEPTRYEEEGGREG